MRGLRSHLTYANVISTLCLILVLGGGAAYAANTVFSSDIVDGEVKAADIRTSAVNSPEIGNGEVLNQDLGADVVDGSKIFDASVGAADLGFESVNSGEIATNAVNGSEVAANAIDSDEILDNSVTGFDLGTGSVGISEIATGAVTNTELGSNSVDGAKVENDSLTALDIGGASNGAITLNSGFVATGRCRDVGISVPGAEPGDAVLFSVNTDLPDGILLSGVRVIDDDVIQGKACNFTGGVFPQLNNIQVAIVTISI